MTKNWNISMQAQDSLVILERGLAFRMVKTDRKSSFYHEEEVHGFPDAQEVIAEKKELQSTTCQPLQHKK